VFGRSGRGETRIRGTVVDDLLVAIALRTAIS
jgi:hypothetical protein